MKGSERVFNVAWPIWEEHYKHPFIQDISQGKLAKERFRYYMVQDHKYLMEYAKVFTMGMVKSTNEADMRLYAAFIQDTINTENAVHQHFLKEFGVTQELIDETPMCLNNESYTNYMMSIALKGGPAEIAVAVLACFWSYKCMGDYFKTVPGAFDHPFYGHWCRTYVSDLFVNGNQTVLDMVDRLSEGYSEEQIKNLETILINCSKYEHQFWDMAYTMGDMDYRYDLTNL